MVARVDFPEKSWTGSPPTAHDPQAGINRQADGLHTVTTCTVLIYAYNIGPEKGSGVKSVHSFECALGIVW